MRSALCVVSLMICLELSLTCICAFFWVCFFPPRLQGAWRWLYKVSQQYTEGLKGLEGHDGCEEEQQQLSAIMSQIQAALQATGEKLEEGPAMLSYPGLSIQLSLI